MRVFCLGRLCWRRSFSCCVWSAVPLGGMDDWLHFSDAWGTDRVGVWKYCLSLFGDFPFGKKLIGGGCGGIGAASGFLSLRQ